MTNRILLEEINRFRLLSGYNNTKTLTENEMEITEAPIPFRDIQAAKGLNIASKELATVTRELESVFPKLNGLAGAERVIRDFKLNTIRNADNVAMLLGKDLVALEKELVKATQQDLKNGIKPLSDTRSAAKDISKMILIRRVMDEQMNIIKNTPKGKVPQRLSGDRINQLSNEVKAMTGERVGKVQPKLPKEKITGEKGKGEKGKGEIKKEDGAIINKGEKEIDIKIDIEVENEIKNIIQKVEKLNGDKGGWRNVWKPGKWTWREIWPYLAVAAGAAGLTGLLIWLFSKNGKQYFPECIGGRIMANPEGLEKTAKAGLPTSHAYMMDSNNPQVSGSLLKSDGVGSQSGSITLPSGAAGTYNVVGNKVEIKAGGDVIYLDCSVQNVIVKTETEDPNPTPKPNVGCTPKSGLPVSYYESNNMVLEVQKCVGASQDGCMGPGTAGSIMSFLALSEKPTQLTQDIYDKVMAKCKGTTKTTTEPIKEPTSTSSGVNPSSSDLLY